MAEHTPEPWALDRVVPECDCPIVSAGDDAVFHCGLDAYNEPDTVLANANRAIACVNALAGTNPSAIPELIEAAREAFGALVGAHASDDSVQGRARIRLRAALLQAGRLRS